jgi:hypothetical protein
LAANVGCLKTISEKIPAFLVTYGVLSLILSAGQFVALMFGCSLCLADESKLLDIVEEPAPEGEAAK